MTGDYSRAEWARYDARWGMWPPTSVTALDPLRAPDTDHQHEWTRCYSCDNGDLICDDCREHRVVPETDEEPQGYDLTDGATAATGAWLSALTVTAGALLALLALRWIMGRTRHD